MYRVMFSAVINPYPTTTSLLRPPPHPAPPRPAQTLISERRGRTAENPIFYARYALQRTSFLPVTFQPTPGGARISFRRCYSAAARRKYGLINSARRGPPLPITLWADIKQKPMNTIRLFVSHGPEGYYFINLREEIPRENYSNRTFRSGRCRENFAVIAGEPWNDTFANRSNVAIVNRIFWELRSPFKT